MYNLLNVLSIIGGILFILGLIGLVILVIYALIDYYSIRVLSIGLFGLVGLVVGIVLFLFSQFLIPRYTAGDVHVTNQLTDKVEVHRDAHNFKQLTVTDDDNDSGVYQVINSDGKKTKFYVTEKETIKQVHKHEWNKGEN